MTIDHSARDEALRRAYNAHYEPLRKRLLEVGLYGETFGDMIDYYKGPVPPEAVQIFLEAILAEVPEEQFGLIHQFVRLKPRFDAAPLLRLFEETGHDEVRWTIGEVLSRPGVEGVDPDWLIRQYRDVNNGDARIMISRAILKYVRRDRAIALMREVFDTLPPSSAYVLGRLGGEAELAFLRAKQAEHAPRTLARKEIEKAIGAIERRLARASNDRSRPPERSGSSRPRSPRDRTSPSDPISPSPPTAMKPGSGSPLEVRYRAVEGEIAPLVGALLDFARTQVQRRGGFLPFGGVVTGTGEVQLVSTAPAGRSERVRSADVLFDLHETLRALPAEREIRVIAVAEDVRIRMPGQRESAAIKVLVEHRDGHCFALYQRHRRRLLFGVRFEDVAVHDADPEVRPWNSIDQPGDTR